MSTNPIKGGWVILGASSAMAKAFARQVAEQGYDVILAGRDMADLERNATDIQLRYQVNATAMAFDATDMDNHPAFAKQCAETIDGTLNLFLAFGAMPEQSEMEESIELTRLCIDSTYTGAVTTLQSFAPELQERAGSKVIVIGSVAGDRGRLGNHIYGSAKGGLHRFTEGFRNRMGRRQVHVMLVKPGFVDTAMTWGLDGLFLVAKPEDVASTCLKAVNKGRNTLYVPWFWWGIMMIIRHVPEIIFKKLSI